MEVQQYQNIKDLVLAKIQLRLGADTSIKKDLTEAFTQWFQDLVMQAKMAQVPMEQPPEGM